MSPPFRCHIKVLIAHGVGKILKKEWLSENSKGRIRLGVGETEKLKCDVKYRV
jgi:hypothetical protein